MRVSLWPTLLLAGLLPLLAHASRAHGGHLHEWAQVEVYDRTDDRPLTLYEHDGRMYVAGEPGHQYELRIRNRSSERLLAVTSVDGVNVITGETADPQQSGYVLDPRHSVEVEGWRKSMDDVATFYFTRLSKSYAARTGRPHDVGVIGVALFRENRPCCRNHPMTDRANAEREAPLASAEADRMEESASARQHSREKLGTGHGHRESSPAQYVNFERASTRPDDTLVIYYDSHKNLVAQGAIRKPRWYAQERTPNPFPQGFVPDP